MIMSLFQTDPIVAVLFVVAIIIAFSVHEWAHAFAAYKNGDWTARLAGRMTLNPVRHIDPVGFLLLLFAGFGYAKPVPVNPYNFRKPRRGIFQTSIAGVTTNFIMAFFAIGLAYFFSEIIFVYYIFIFFLYFALINAGLLVFNLIPIYPLDGFNIITSFTKRNNKFVQFMTAYGMYFFIALIGLGFIVDYMGLPEYIDILSFVISNVRYYLFWPIDKIWQLIFGSPYSIWMLVN